MRVVLMAVVAAGLTVSGCDAIGLGGGGDKAELVKACVADGEEQKTCDCVADELEKTVDKDAFKAMVLGAQGKDAEAEAIMEGLSMEKQFSVATGAMGAMAKCGGFS